MKATSSLGYSSIASFLVIGLAACGGGSDTTPSPQAGGSAGPSAPIACTGGRYSVDLGSSSGPSTGEPRIVRASLTCWRGNYGSRVAGLPIDWTVTNGGGSIGGQSTVQTVTDVSGSATVTWDFGSSGGVQSIEARFNGASPSVHASVSHTVLVPDPNRCEAPGGTDLGSGRTISSAETWTKAASPYFTTGEVMVTNGAALIIEPGATICVNKIVAKDAGRVVASGTAGEPIYFGIRNRADHWKGFDLQPPANGVAMSGPSVFTHAVIENASEVKVLAHPIVVEDSLMRRVLPAARTSHCATFLIRQHSVAGIEASRVVRTVIDGLGGGDIAWWSPWDYGGCSALVVWISDSSPLVVSARVINSRAGGVQLFFDGFAADANHTLLTNCEISGSASNGLLSGYNGQAQSSPRVTSCNIFGNAGVGVHQSEQQPQLAAHGNWWGDPAGAQGPKGDGVFGNVDASNPLAAPVVLGY